MRTADIIVVGLGAAGSACVFQVARRGASVIGIDRFSPPHIHGSTHGGTRVTREAIGEGEMYVPFVRRAHEIWREIERETSLDLLTQCGGLFISSGGASRGISPAQPDFIQATIDCARAYGIEHQLLTADDIGYRFPQFTLRGNESGYYEPGAGFVRPEACVSAELSLAEKHGAQLRLDERVLGIASEGGGVAVRTDEGKYSADHVVLSAGPWIAGHVPPRMRSWFRVYRQFQAWFALEDVLIDHSPDAMPIFIWDTGGENAYPWFYGFPAVDGSAAGLKIATDQLSVTTDADTEPLDVDPSEPQALYDRYVAGRLAGVEDRCIRAARCLYTCTPDDNFVIDWHPEVDGVLVVSPCSGHGFKHSPAIGEAVAEYVLTGTSKLDLTPFAFSRLESQPSSPAG